jgi:GDP-L-fucose synthase
MELNSKIYIAGHKGMVGSAIWRNLEVKGYTNLIGKTLEELDLLNQQAVADFFETEKPEYVILAAAKVGGIVANNTYRAEFIYENLQIQNNIIHQSYLSGVKKLLFLGSSCIYPKDAPQPLKEEYLLTGPLEYTNEPYAIAKIAGIKMCENYYKQYGCNFISVMPTNLYGPNDNYDLEKSHVLPALIRKFHLGKCVENNDWEAIRADLNKRPIEGVDGQASNDDILEKLSKYGIRVISSNQRNQCSVELWGTGNVYREFLHVDDMADACVFIMENVDFSTVISTTKEEKSQTSEGDSSTALGMTESREIRNTHLNIGTGIDLTIKELAETVKSITGFHGIMKWDITKPDGTSKKQLDISLLHKLDWKHKIELRHGIELVYKNYCACD